MALQCNIDRTGRLVRLVAGASTEGAGLLLLALRWTGQIGGDWPWFVGSALAVSGLVMSLEGALGWCVLRAWGFQTRI